MTVVVSRHNFSPDDVWPLTCRWCGRHAAAHVNPETKEQTA